MPVTVEHRAHASGTIATVTHDRQSRLNALDSASVADLTRVFEELGTDEKLRAVVLTGAGAKAFVGGADLNELRTLDEDSARRFISGLHRLFRAMRTLPVPVIARVNGYSLGAGMEMAAAADIRIASSNAVFGMPEVQVGLPSVIEAALLPRLVGWGRSSWLVMTGQVIDAATADRWGFLEQLVGDQAELDAAVGETADAIASAGPLAVRAQKRLVNDWERLSIEDGVRAGIEALARSYRTDEPRLMMQRFFDRKRSG